jgi:hypothetical protein
MHPFVEISKRSSVPLAGDRERLQRHLSRSGRVAGLLEEEWPGLFLIAPLLEGLKCLSDKGGLKPYNGVCDTPAT